MLFILQVSILSEQIKSTNSPSASNRTKRSDNGSGKNPKRTDEKKRRASTKLPGSRVRQKNTRKGVEGDERRGKEPSGKQLKG